MSEGDLVQTVIEQKPVILIRKATSRVWEVLTPNGKIRHEWVLNLEPYEQVKF
jgi:glycine/D-amino acid oxidase-like deaminating enzyme